MTSPAIVPIHSWGAMQLDGKVMLSTFGLIFVAELGDKTQFPEDDTSPAGDVL